MPQGAEEIYPDTQATLAEIAERWDLARADLGRLIDKAAVEDFRCGVFCHPFAGWMTLEEVLDHFSAHLCHHGFQLERLRVGAAGLDGIFREVEAQG